MNEKQEKNVPMWNSNLLGDELVTPELEEEMRKYPYGSQHHKQVKDIVCFATFSIGPLKWYILEAVPWGKNNYLLWCVMCEPSGTTLTDITTKYLVDFRISGNGRPILDNVVQDRYFKPCKLSEIHDDQRIEKFVAEMTELEKKYPEEKDEPCPNGWYPDLWDDEEKSESMPHKLVDFFDVII